MLLLIHESCSRNILVFLFIKHRNVFDVFFWIKNYSGKAGHLPTKLSCQKAL